MRVDNWLHTNAHRGSSLSSAGRSVDKRSALRSISLSFPVRRRREQVASAQGPICQLAGWSEDLGALLNELLLLPLPNQPCLLPLLFLQPWLFLLGDDKDDS